MSRISPLDPPYAADVQSHFERIMGKGAEPLMLFRILAKNERVWKKFSSGSLLDKGPLTLRQREIVVDRTCAQARCEYEWGVHVAIFQQPAKLTDEQVTATVSGSPDAACWTIDEQVLIAAVDALHRNATWTSEEFKALSLHYSEAQIFEILLLCGFYRTVSYIANGLNIPLEPTAARFPK